MLTIRISSGGNEAHLKLVAHAVSDCGNYAKTLLVASMVGSTSEVAAAKAMLSGRNRCGVTIAGFEHMSLDSDKGYRVKIARLPAYNQSHMVLRSKRKTLVMGSMEEAVRSYLFSDTIDTPILPEWVPWLTRRLVEERRVGELRCVGCDAWLCNFHSTGVDSLVSEGVKGGWLRLVDRDAAPKLAIFRAC